MNLMKIKRNRARIIMRCRLQLTNCLLVQFFVYLQMYRTYAMCRYEFQRFQYICVNAKWG